MLAFIVRTLNFIFEEIAYHGLIQLDRLRGVDFHEMDMSKVGDGYRYECTHPRIMIQLSRICRDATPSDAILDLGCGKGRMLEFFSSYPFRMVDGVEYSQELASIAARNISRLNLESRVFCADVRDFTDWDEYNWFYFYNPFPSFVMKACLEGILKSLEAHPRKIVLLYANPTCHRILLSYGFKEKSFRQTFIERIWAPYLSVLKVYVR